MSDRYLFFLVAFLLTIGLVFSYSLPIYLTQTHKLSEFHFLFRQSVAVAIAIFIMWAIARLDPDVWIKRIGFGLFGIFLVVLFIMPFFPDSIVPTINGARRWIRLGFLSISPVEFFKVGFIYFLAWSLNRKLVIPKTIENFTFAKEIGTLVPYGLIFIVAVVLIAVMQNDLGQVVVLGTTMTLMIFFAGSSPKVFVFLMATMILGGTILISQTQNRIDRMVSWWVTVQDFILSFFPDFIANALKIEGVATSQQYQVTQAAHAINHGGFMGVGFGGGVVKLGFLSDVHNDFVLAGIAEETGFLGVMIVSLVILLIIYRIFRIANRSSDEVFYLFSIGIGTTIAVQFLLNALGSVGLIPLKGITAPFVSYGGTSILGLAFAIGMVLMISQKAKM